MNATEDRTINNLKISIVELEHSLVAARRDVLNARYQHDACIGWDCRDAWRMEEERLTRIVAEMEAELQARRLELERLESNCNSEQG